MQNELSTELGKLKGRHARPALVCVAENRCAIRLVHKPLPNARLQVRTWANDRRSDIEYALGYGFAQALRFPVDISAIVRRILRVRPSVSGKHSVCGHVNDARISGRCIAREFLRKLTVDTNRASHGSGI